MVVKRFFQLYAYVLNTTSDFDHYSTDHFHMAESSQTLLAEHLTFEEFRIEWCTDKDPTALPSLLLLRQEGLRVVEIA